MSEIESTKRDTTKPAGDFKDLQTPDSETRRKLIRNNFQFKEETGISCDYSSRLSNFVMLLKFGLDLYDPQSWKTEMKRALEGIETATEHAERVVRVFNDQNPDYAVGEELLINDRTRERIKEIDKQARKMKASLDSGVLDLETFQEAHNRVMDLIGYTEPRYFIANAQLEALPGKKISLKETDADIKAVEPW